MNSETRTVRLSHDLYPLEAIDKAKVAFETLCEIRTELAQSGLMLSIEPLPGAPSYIVDEFLSYALSAALEMHLSQES